MLIITALKTNKTITEITFRHSKTDWFIKQEFEDQIKILLEANNNF